MAHLGLGAYMDRATNTVIYPSPCTPVGVAYVTLGLLDELITEVRPLCEVDERDTEDFVSEIGDACWYAGLLCVEMQADLPNQMMSIVDDTLGCGIDLKYLDPSKSLLETCDMLINLAGELAACAKKHLRDERDLTSFKESKYHRKCQGYLGALWYNLYHMCRFTGDDLDDRLFDAVLEGNLNKLFDRQKRDVLGGDGDKR